MSTAVCVPLSIQVLTQSFNYFFRLGLFTNVYESKAHGYQSLNWNYAFPNVSADLTGGKKSVMCNCRSHRLAEE